jgi:hypothetical protein
MLHDAVIDLLEVLENPTDYYHMERIWIIPEAVRQSVESRFEKLGEPKRRDAIRRAVEVVFGLQEKDIVLFLHGRLYIRNYTPPKRPNDGRDRRFNGQDPDEMIAIYRHHFPEGLDAEVEELLPEIIDEGLNFGTIDNDTFKKSFITVYRSMIEIILAETVGDLLSPSKLDGFVGFVLRRYFDMLLKQTARRLLDFVEERHRNAEVFIKYYKDEVIIDGNGKKIQKYAIVDTKGQTWNYSSILSVLMQHTQAEARVAQQAEKLQHVRERINALRQSVGYDRAAMDSADVKARDAKLVCEHKKQLLMRDYGFNDEGELIAHMTKEYLPILENCKASAEIAAAAGRRYRNKKTELENWKKQLSKNEQYLEEVKEQKASIDHMLELIVDALARTFAKR